MAVSAHDVAAVLRQRQPSLPVKKLHKLLYYCQGYHLAATGTPLFSETISAWDMGPVVGRLWYREHHGGDTPEPQPLSEAELNSIGYVLSRYGALTGLDLEHLTHQEEPYLLADRDRPPGTSVRMEIDWIKAYFTTSAGEPDPEEDVVLDADVVKGWLAGAGERRLRSAREDAPEDIRARLATDS